MNSVFHIISVLLLENNGENDRQVHVNQKIVPLHNGL